jgi:hypothetical protein
MTKQDFGGYMRRELFWWRYSPNVIKNKGDVIIPWTIAVGLPKDVMVDFDGNVYNLKIDSRFRIRGRGCSEAIYKWLVEAKLTEGDLVPVYFEDPNKIIFDSSKAKQANE